MKKDCGQATKTSSDGNDKAPGKGTKQPRHMRNHRASRTPRIAVTRPRELSASSMVESDMSPKSAAQLHSWIPNRSNNRRRVTELRRYGGTSVAHRIGTHCRIKIESERHAEC